MEPIICPQCNAELTGAPVYARYGVCDECGHHFRISARQRLLQLADPGTFRQHFRTVGSVDPLEFADKIPYPARLREAQEKTGLREAVLTGIGEIGGIRAALAVVDFEFLGGSMGSAVGEKITLAFEMAQRRRLPMITVVSSGGARMQEGMLSLMQMAKTAGAAARLHEARLPYISVLANPTTGGMYASFANLGDVTLAEPQALIGFAGPRVIEQVTGQPLPPGSHTAESVLEHGMIDAVVPRPRLRDTLTVLLGLLTSPYRLTNMRETDIALSEPAPTEETAWETVQLARRLDRPTSLDYLHRIATTFFELHGDRLQADDPAIVCGLADLAGQTVMFIGQERSRNEGQAMPEGYRKAQRAMRLATKFHLPVVTFIDTPGAQMGLEAEYRGIARALSTSLGLMSTLPVPIISVIIGEGGSGGALALSVADRILMLENAIYSVISPEGCAAILYRDADRAADVAPALKLTAHDLREAGVIDVVVSEPTGGAHLEPAAAWQIKRHLVQELTTLQRIKIDKLKEQRYKKFRRIGKFTPLYQRAVSELLRMLKVTDE
ncbi:MAG: acetyl-CoA carboxylase carboxyl transferase subunit beta [Chloroflexi bacterium]|nr:acetyl-CoA carboxylase carboxyl transferase subunit beta [Chloroflexota bacterium]